MSTLDLRLKRNDGDVIRIDLQGRISRDGANAHTDPLSEVYGVDVYAKAVLLNLAGTTYLDSSGVDWLLSCQKRFQKHGGKLVLCSPAPVTQQFLKMMRLDLVLTVASDEAAGRALLQTQNGESSHA